MSAVKQAFEKIGEGLKHIGEGIIHGIEGVVKTIGGALTANPKLMKEGAEEFDKSHKEMISGAGETLGGIAGAAIGATPLGAAINSMTGGAASRLAQGAFEGVSNTVNKGISGAEEMVGGALTGDVSKFAAGALAFGDVALDAVPGFGEEKMAAEIAISAGKSLVKSSAKEGAGNEVTG